MTDGSIRYGIRVSPEEAPQYEQECLALLRERIKAYRGGHSPTKIAEVHLEGSYPDTRICARRWKASRPEWHYRCYELWGSSLSTAHRHQWHRQFYELLRLGPPPRSEDDRREIPSEVAMLVHTWLED